MEGEKEETRGKFVSLNRSIRSSRFKFIVSFVFFISWQGERGTEEDGAGESTGGVEGEKLRRAEGEGRGKNGAKVKRKVMWDKRNERNGKREEKKNNTEDVSIWIRVSLLF